MPRYIKTTRGNLTVGQTEREIKEILNGLPFGQMEDVEQIRFVVSVLRHHPRKDEKFRGGCSGISIRRNMYNTRGFHVHRPDGTTTDISYREAIRPSTDKGKMRQALRLAVDSWMIAEKNRLWDDSAIDAVTGEEIGQFSECDLDHVGVEFNALADAWLAENGAPRLVTGDNIIGDEFADASVRQSWFDYHAANARVQIVHRETHKRITRERRAG